MNNLPEKNFEQEMVLQSCSTDSDPSQDDDPFGNVGVVQVRCWPWNPVPHTWEHSLQLDHLDQIPFELKIKKILNCDTFCFLYFQSFSKHWSNWYKTLSIPGFEPPTKKLYKKIMDLLLLVFDPSVTMTNQTITSILL